METSCRGENENEQTKQETNVIVIGVLFIDNNGWLWKP